MVDWEQEKVFLLITEVSSEVSVTIRTSYSVSASNSRSMYLKSGCLVTRETIARKLRKLMLLIYKYMQYISLYITISSYQTNKRVITDKAHLT